MNLGALDATAATWFGSELEYVHGINIMPVTPATSLLIDQAFVMIEWPVLGSRLTPATPPASKLCAANQGNIIY